MTYRVERVNSLIREELSDLLHRQVKDPRLGGFISITEVETAPDMRHAKVYISYLGDDEKKQEVIKVLTSASAFFRRELSKRLKMRHTPELEFRLDISIERGDRIERLIEGIKSEEEHSEHPEDKP